MKHKVIPPTKKPDEMERRKEKEKEAKLEQQIQSITDKDKGQAYILQSQI
jgi:hypothetical protein